MKIHDWFYEATAAGVVMQAEILLTSRDRKAMAHYLPKMERACDFIEKTRDPKNNLFLVGPACNLLAPSYGGVKQPDGTFGKGYLAGLSITYLAALDRMVELYKLAGDRTKLAEYEHRQKITRESLPQLLTPAGYFVKSIEPGGVKHGVLGQEEVRLPRRRGQRRRRGAPRGRRRHGPVDLSADRGLPRHPALRLPADQRAGPGRHLCELRQAPSSKWTGSTSSAIGSTAACWGTVEGRAILVLLPARQVRRRSPLGRAGHEMGQGLPHGRPLVATRREHQQSVVRYRGSFRSAAWP